MWSEITENPIFQSIQRKRTLTGLLSGIVSFGMLVGVLCTEIVPKLDSSWGSHFSWKLWTGEGWWEIVIAGVIILWSTLVKGNRFEADKKLIRIYPILEEPITTTYNVEDIRDISLDLSGQMGVDLEAIYIGEEPVPNAFATFAVDSGDIMVLNSNLIDIMDRESLRSVIAHELGHVVGNDVLFRIGNILPKIIAMLLFFGVGIKLTGILLLSTGIIEVFCRLLVLIVAIVVMTFATMIMNGFENVYGRQKEIMADLYAAHFTSVEASINSFLRLNSRSHALTVFVELLNKETGELDSETVQLALKNFPSGSMNKEEIERLIPRSYAQAHLQRLLESLSIQIPEEVLNEWVEKMVEYRSVEKADESDAVHVEEEVAEVGEAVELSQIPFAWRTFDWNHDGLLQRGEIVAMLQALKEDPKALAEDEGGGTHPSIRNRIELLADVFELG